MLVLVSHCYVLTRPGVQDPISETFGEVMPLSRGLAGQGVALFFVLSGFLVTQSYLRRGDLSRFAVARVLRIFPALWCAIAVTIAVGAMVTIVDVGDFLTSKRTIEYATHNGSLIDLRYILPGVFVDNPVPEVNISLWTLPIEFALYAAVALIGVIGLARRAAWFNALAAAVVVAYVAADSRLPVISDRHDSELILFFLAGAALYVNRGAIPLRGSFATGALALMVLLSLPGTRLFNVAVIACFAYCILWLGFTRRWRLPDLSARGDLSYATYLYACPATQVWIVIVGVVSPLLLVGLTTLVVLPIAWLSWHLVEAPALRQRGRLLGIAGRRQSATTAA